jgi:carboxyl-terminal processing protease
VPNEPKPEATRSDVIWLRLFVVSVGLLIAVVGFGSGMLAERAIFAPDQMPGWWREIGGFATDAAPREEPAFPRLAEVKHLIEEEYYFRPSAPDDAESFVATLDRDAAAGIAAVAATPAATLAEYERQLETAAIRAMTDGLPDDYSIYLEPLAHAPLAEDLRGEYEGIGVWVDHKDGVLTIVSPIPGSPADEAGLRPGDVIEAADGHPLAGVSQEEALKLIRGPAGTTVRLTIRRPDQHDPLDVPVVRQAITVPAVIYEPVAGGRVAWIAITSFGDHTTAQLDAALRQAREDGVEGIVLDLRQNAGGWVTAAQETIGRFVPAERGPALYEDTAPGDGDAIEAEPIIGGGEEVFSLPMVVLVDGGTASASEIVAGALRDYGRAKLVGTPTFGKGLVQRVHDFADGASLRLTFAGWLTPNQTPIPEEGLAPDILVEVPEDTPADVDPQLDQAIALVLAGG